MDLPSCLWPFSFILLVILGPCDAFCSLQRATVRETDAGCGLLTVDI